MARGALVVDIRPEAQRAGEGQLGFGVIVERNVFEWRFDLDGPDCLPKFRAVTNRSSSSVRRATHQPGCRCASRLGYTAASDLVGGFRAWQALRNKEATASRERLAAAEA